MSYSVTHSFYFDKCVPAVHGLSSGQRFGHVLSGSLEGALSQTFPQCFGIHLRQQDSTIRRVHLLTLAVSAEKNCTCLQELARHFEIGRRVDAAGLQIFYDGGWNSTGNGCQLLE